MSDKLLLELYERVVALEEKVAALEKMSKNPEIIEKPNEETISEVKGKYRYLSDYLLKSGKNIVDLTFSEIEKIIQDKLPPSCRKHRALWANSESHSLALAWMNVGYRTTDVDMEKETVRFEKIRTVK